MLRFRGMQMNYDDCAEDWLSSSDWITEGIMTKKPAAKKTVSKDSENGVYKIVEIVGSSSVSWEDAARVAVESAAKTLRDMRVAEVVKLDLKIDNGKVVAYRARVSMSFQYEG